MQNNVSDQMQAIASEVYYSIRQKTGTNEALTVLHIADEFSLLATGRDSRLPEKVWILDIGSIKTAHDFFKQTPPTPGEVENAINVVEEEVMSMHKLLESNTRLYTSDIRTLQIAKLTAFTESESGIILLRPDLEQLFSRLAAIVSGRPASTDVLPAHNSFAATLLILREVMHHLGFMDITICD